MKRNFVLAAALLGLPILVGLAACNRNTQTPTPSNVQLNAEQLTDSRQKIVAYLECEECTDGELEAVTKLGEPAVSTLAAVLRDGPAPAKRESYRRQLAATYQDLKEYAAKHPEAKVPMSEEEYIKTYLDNQAALHRIRAATALAAIGGEQARKALEAAQAANPRDDVKAAVQAALSKTRR